MTHMNRNNTVRLKSTIVFAPAGSGKTEELSRRYLELVKNGVKPERILTLTFTDKAAAEMKERILRNARTDYPDLYQILKDNILRLRISTIHSFCYSLVQRFADLLGIDPHPGVLSDYQTLWEQAKYDTLMKIADGQFGAETREMMISLLSDTHRIGWNELAKLFEALFRKRNTVIRTGGEDNSYVQIDLKQTVELACRLRADICGQSLIDNYEELFSNNYADEKEIFRIARLLSSKKNVFLTQEGNPRQKGFNSAQREWAALMADYYYRILIAGELIDFRRKFLLFKKCFLETYEQQKREQGMVDYDDMELLALRLLTENPDWLNILYIFDEHTDHILVDEFQDTSYLQWAIIDKLSEEWRSGAGIKSELGITPTIFIVGDDKQSIYMFRDARVEIFSLAQDKLANWLGNEALEIRNLEKNYRSLPAIIDFNNTLFSRLMQPPADSPPWFTRYRPFTCQRNNLTSGKVELLIEKVDSEINMPEACCIDAENVARRIRQLIDSRYQIYERQPDGTEMLRSCCYRDIAILLRSRSNFLAAIENSLRKYQIPFLVVGGTGFYEEPEVQYLTALTKFLIDPADDLSLYITLRGPLFLISEHELFFAVSSSKNSSAFLWEKISHSDTDLSPSIQDAVQKLTDAQQRIGYEPLHLILDRLLVQTRAWSIFWEPQREANVRKFLQVIHELELSGLHLLRIRTFLDQPSSDEPKADVPTEEMNAVQVMTVHAAKGLQFPIVFHPGLHESITGRVRSSADDRLLVEETAFNQVRIFYLKEATLRNNCDAYIQHKLKQIEEEKRIFYVACTRARDALFLTGIWMAKKPKDSKLEWLHSCLGLEPSESGFTLGIEIPGVEIVSPSFIPDTPPVTASDQPQKIVKKDIKFTSNNPPVLPIGRFIPRELKQAPEEALGIGEIIHRLLELFSKGKISPDTPAMEQEILRQLRIKCIPKQRHAKLAREILAHINRLIESPVWEIIKPQPDAYAELPITYNDGERILNGRIDRIIVQEGEVRVYDYKTFPIKKGEIAELTAEYNKFQLSHYRSAISELFPNKKVKTFVIFTHFALVVPVDTE